MITSLVLVACDSVGANSQPSPSQPAATNTAALAWDAVGGAIGYRVYSGTASGTYDTVTSLGNVTTYTTDPLSTKTTYYFVVTAFDVANNESGFSNEVSKAIP